MLQRLARFQYPMWEAAKALRDLSWVVLLIARDRRVPRALHGLTGSGLWYVIVPYDLIPDGVPIYGYIDDLAVVTACLLAARHLIAPAVVRACWSQVVLPPGLVPAVEGVWVLADDRTGNVNQCLGAAAREGLGAPFPELVISAGRRTAPVARNIKRRSLGQAMIVHLMDPGWAHGDFDLVAVP